MSHRSILCAVVAAACVPGVASAQLYQYRLTGEVSGFSGAPDAAAVLGAEFSIGEAASITVIYDGATPPTSTGGNTADYDGVTVSIDGTIGDYTFTRASSPLSNSMDLTNGNINGDEVFIFCSTTGADVGITSMSSMFFRLTDADDIAFPGGFNNPSPPPPLTVPIPFDEFETVSIGSIIFLPSVAGPARGGGGAEYIVDLNITSVSNITQVSTVGVMSEQSSSYVINTPRGGEPQNSSNSNAQLTVASLGTFGEQFSTIGDADWTVTWTAPAGTLIEIAVPTGFNRVDLAIDFWAGNFSTAGGLFSLVAPDVDYLPGSPTLSWVNDQMFTTGPGGDLARALADSINLNPGDVIRFGSISMTLPIPASYDVDFSSPISAFFIAGEASYTGPVEVPVPADPGQWLRLVPICPGDVNGDGVTDVFDFADLAASFGAGPGATRGQGDLNGDGFVDVFDFGDLAADFGCGSD